jgi:diguanylate cyclase (GGDEF)-like protein
VKKSVERLLDKNEDDFDRALDDIVLNCSAMECAYILDGAGIQISRTICSEDETKSHENLIFYAARKGTDHSMEKYYYPLIIAKRNRYTTEPYISLATGNLCITISYVFLNKENNKCVFCADFKTPEDSYNIELRGPVINPVLKARPDMVGILNKMNEEIIAASLTGAYIRRYMEESLLVDSAYTEDNGNSLSVILCDIDRFKSVNDRYGHLAGDQVLRDFVNIARRFIRKESDWIARYGGDEFLVVLVNANETVAGRVAEKIRSACEQAVVSYEASTIRFTVSLGTYTVHSQKMTIEEILRLADKNLYMAKKSGRNQTVQASIEAISAKM